MSIRDASPTLGAIARAPFLALLLSLLTLFLLSPFSGMGYLFRAGVALAATAVVFSTLRLVAMHRRWLVVGVLVGLSGSLLKVSNELWQAAVLFAVSDILLLFFLLLLSVMILAHVLRSPRITMDSVMGAACVYLLMGFIWAKLFILVEWLVPGSFDLSPLIPEGLDRASRATAESGQLTYLSFITLTTVGYGDLTPIKPAAQMLSMLEGLAGQLYVAIMIARMVALQVAQNITGRNNM
ncbi:MAG: two pore domain potassium channel family protein [Acidobacteria bacterium]|nr:MAG: two pore domain potassium channel family protein [Acidobacteriota bacterium]